MNKFGSITKPLTWLMALLLTAVVAGCGGSDDTWTPASSAKAITAFSIGTNVGTIDQAAKTIAVGLPSGTAVTALVATYTTTGASVKVGTTAQTSGATPNNFTAPVIYTVIAADNTRVTYTVTAAPPGLNLRTTASFAVLAPTLTNNVGTTTATGDVGATTETLSGTLTMASGTHYAGCAVTACSNALTDLPLVITDANDAGLFPCSSTITGGDLAGATLTPGVTCAGANAIGNTGIVTLNGPGVYIIRTTGALTAGLGSSVAFFGGATNANTSVFWVVGSADFTSSVGSPVSWKGTILANGAVTLGDSATLVNGRVLAATAVTMTNNTITKP